MTDDLNVLAGESNEGRIPGVFMPPVQKPTGAPQSAPVAHPPVAPVPPKPIPQAQPPVSNDPEPVILEERVIPAPPKIPVQQQAPVTQPPQPKPIAPIPSPVMTPHPAPLQTPVVPSVAPTQNASIPKPTMPTMAHDDLAPIDIPGALRRPAPIPAVTTPPKTPPAQPAAPMTPVPERKGENAPGIMPPIPIPPQNAISETQVPPPMIDKKPEDIAPQSEPIVFTDAVLPAQTIAPPVTVPTSGEQDAAVHSADAAPIPVESTTQPESHPDADHESVLVAPQATGGSVQDEISKLLKGIKLPERRDTHASGDKKVIEFKPISDVPKSAVLKPSPEAPKTLEKTAETANVTALHTLKDDLQDVVREKKISVVRAAALEQQKRTGQEHFVQQPSPATTQRSKRTRAIVFVAFILFVLGGFAIAGVLFLKSQVVEPSATTTTQSSILFAEDKKDFPIDNITARDLKSQLSQARGDLTGALGAITRVTPVISLTNEDGSVSRRPATVQEFFTAIGARIPDELSRAIGPDFFFGIHTVDNNVPVLVIPVTSYDHAFAGMLTWEATMNADLAPIFTAVPALRLDSAGLPVARSFEDGILQNYDVRQLKDDSRNIDLYYSFPKPNILVIAESTYSFSEILSRLQAGRKL